MALFFCRELNKSHQRNIGFGVLYPEVETYSIAPDNWYCGFRLFLSISRLRCGARILTKALQCRLHISNKEKSPYALYKLTFTSNGFGSKDEAKDNVKKRRAEWHCGERTKGDITNGILNGCIFSHAITDNGMQPSVEHSKGFQSIWLDIDDDGKSTIDEQIATLAIKPSIAYTTYSHRPEEGKYKYRMVYLIDEAIFCPYHRYTDMYVAFVKNVMRKPANVLQEWFSKGCPQDKSFTAFGVDMSLSKLSQIEFTTTPDADIRQYDTILRKSDIESLSVGYTGKSESNSVFNSKAPRKYSESTSYCTTFEDDREWWDDRKESLYQRAYFSTDNLIHFDGYDVRGDGYDMMPERYRYCSMDIAGNKVWGLFLNKWKKGEGRKYIVNRAAQILLHNVPTLTDEETFHFLIRWADNVMYRNSGGDIITDDMLRYSIAYAHVHPWQPSPKVAKKNPVNSVIIDRTSPRWAGMGSRKPSGIVRSERRIQRAIDGICFGIENNLTLAEMVAWINGRKEENTTNKIYGRAFSEKSLLALVRKLYKKVIVDNEAYASADNIIYSLSFDDFFNLSSDILRLIELNRKRRNANWERIMEMHQQGMSSLEISKSLGISKRYVNKQISLVTGGNITERFQTPTTPPTTKRDLNLQNLVPTDVTKGYNILEGLFSGATIPEIAAETGINIRTIKRYIKKAKDSGILRNEGTRKFPKWVLISEEISFRTGGNTNEGFQIPNENIQPESLDSISKEKENTKETTEEIKEKDINIMIIDGDTYTPAFDYADEDYINDITPVMATSHYGDIDDIPEEDLGEPYITFSIQPTPMIAPKPAPKPDPKTSQIDRYRNMESSGMDSKEIEGLRERLSKLTA